MLKVTWNPEHLESGPNPARFFYKGHMSRWTGKRSQQVPSTPSLRELLAQAFPFLACKMGTHVETPQQVQGHPCTCLVLLGTQWGLRNLHLSNADAEVSVSPQGRCEPSTV